MERGITRTHLASLITLCALVGCDKPEAPAPAPPPVSPTSCSDYATRVCSEVTSESPLCKSTREAVEVMAPEACAVALTNIHASLQKIADKLKPCKDLVEKICADLGPNTQSCNMARSTTPGYTAQRCSGMLSNYAEILKPLKAQEDRQKPLSPELIAKLGDAATAVSFGPADAKVSLVEFADFEDPYSGRAMSAVHAVLDQYGQQIRFVFRHFPAEVHRGARIAAEASLAANAQGKFWAFHDKAFNNQSLLSRSHIERYAKEVGMDVSKLKKALDANTYAAQVDADLKLAAEAVVDRTPSLFLNGKRVMNPADPGGLAKQIEDALKSAS